MSDVAPMPPSCFNSAHCPDGSTSSAPGQQHTIYLSNVGRDKGGVEPMTMYERGTRLYRLDPGVISRNSSCSRTALPFEPFHDLDAASSVASRQTSIYGAHRLDTHAYHSCTGFDACSSVRKTRHQRQVRLDTVPVGELSGSTDTIFGGRQLPKKEIRALARTWKRKVQMGCRTVTMIRHRRTCASSNLDTIALALDTICSESS